MSHLENDFWIPCPGVDPDGYILSPCIMQYDTTDVQSLVISYQTTIHVLGSAIIVVVALDDSSEWSAWTIFQSKSVLPDVEDERSRGKPI